MDLIHEIRRYGRYAASPIDSGASVVSTELLSIEKLKENTYRSNYLRIYVSGESDEESTVFEVKKS